MRLSEKLDELREKFPACQVLAFADNSTGMVLCSSSAEKLRQERLDALCDRAIEALGGDAATCVRAAVKQLEGGIFKAITIEPAEVGIFLKSKTNPDDVLCCVCSPAVALEEFISSAYENLTLFGKYA